MSIVELSSGNCRGGNILQKLLQKHGYPLGYAKPKPIYAQVKIIHELFPNVEWGYYRPNEKEIVIPGVAEGLFAVPRWRSLAPTYCKAVQLVLDKIKQTRGNKFCSYREGQIGTYQLHQLEDTLHKLEIIEQAQNEYDILVFAAQFGINHCGSAVSYVRDSLYENEFCLDTFSVGIMLLTHPERLMSYDDLWIDCAGDKYAPEIGDTFSSSPCFCFNEKGLEYSTADVLVSSIRTGSATGFFPK